MSGDNGREQQPEDFKKPGQPPAVPDRGTPRAEQRGTGDDIVEDDQPPADKFLDYRPPPPHIDSVRRNLAVGLVVLLAGMVVFGAVGWFRGHDLQTYVLLFSPVVTLVGTVLGFYFSDNGK